ncbi:hypothetical protein [Helicobacter colisuis]|uniref:Lipoprotein n=1 Tax=Helicobacter colisuis TaxID=2949739 RepID=A0ABT0TVZ4_9HELI|nr:hypothetical protein [Helicobacter colisuis]MCL9820102.1 hypothetical protein [Helicobacter colisuis]
MKKSIFNILCILLLCGCDEIAQKGSQTLQETLENSGLKDTLINKSEKLNDFNNQAKDFLQKQSEILQREIEKALEDNKTKELLEEQIKSLNNLLESKSKNKTQDQKSNTPNEKEFSPFNTTEEIFRL